MPELPEVETIRRGLHERIVHQHVREILIHRPEIIVGCPDEFATAFEGNRVTSTGRRGKVLWLAFARQGLCVHLGMSGRLYLHNGSDHPPHTHLVVTMEDGAEVVYVDPRRFGRLERIDLLDLNTSRILRNVGTDALDPAWTAQRLLEEASVHSIAIKEFLLDQTHVAGVGNIYASEILHRARVAPHRPANRLSAAEAKRIVHSTREVLRAAIAAGGTTISDHTDALGRPGTYQHHLRVYDREGESCTASGCAGEIERTVQGGRSTYLCPVCQQ